MLDTYQKIDAWNKFIHQQEICPELNPLVVNSWKRCWARLNPYRESMLKKLAAEHLLAAQVASFDLISLTRPVMEDIYQYIEGSGSILLLTNGAGYVLDLMGDSDYLEMVGQIGIVPGALVAEVEMGTNAISLSLYDRSPICVVGAEHFLQRYHIFADAAAPIFDLHGRPLGSLGVLSLAENFHLHSLGLVVAGARAVEGQMQSDYLLAEQSSHLAQLNAILEANTDGVIVFNPNGFIMKLNSGASKMLGMSVPACIGQHVNDIFVYPDFIIDAIRQRSPLSNVETTLRAGNNSIHCVLSVKYALSQQQLQWVIMILRLERDVRQLAYQQFGAQAPLSIEDIPGASSEIRRQNRFVQVAAPAKASILIRGEIGTGKNILASAIHNASPRRDGPYLIFGCSIIPQEWVVRELLGFDESVSGKKPGGRPSKFELANGGTLFFQNIDDLPLDAQSILLNVLDLGIVQRIGSDQPIEVDVRIIASIAADIEKLIAEGNFRADLYYRLSAFEITLAPLRERPGDLKMLTERILERLERQLGHSLTLSSEAMAAIKHYRWPGNIRELESVLGRASVQAGPGGIIQPIHLPETIFNPYKESNGTLTMSTLYNVEREAFLQAAQTCKGNVSDMARRLGISRTTVWRRLKEMQINPDDFRITEN